MKEYRLLVLVAPVEGREDEFNFWHQNIHIPEVVSAKGFKVARRFRTNQPTPGYEKYQYMAIYEIETDNLERTLAEASKNAKTMSDSVRPDSYICIYEPLGAPVKYGDPVNGGRPV